MDPIALKASLFLGFLIIAATCLLRVPNQMEAEIIQESMAALCPVSLVDPVVSAEGLTISVAGTVHSTARREAAVARLRAIPGVRRLVSEIAVVAPPPEAAAIAIQNVLDVLLSGKRIAFKANAAVLLDSSVVLLSEVAAILKKYPEAVIEIAGHTDNIGNEVLNRQLSEQRAGAVKRYLTVRGISPARLTVSGYGSAKPIADNRTVKGRQLNRRVEFIVRLIGE